MVDELRAIQALPILSWRGAEHQYYDDASIEWDNGQAKQRYPYVNGTKHDGIGLSDDSMPVRLYFLNSLEAGLFPDVWNEWFRELRDPEPGDLVHPLLGKVRAVVERVKVTLNAQNTGGVIADVVWSTDLKDPEEELQIQPIKANLKALTIKAGESSSDAGIFLPDEQAVTDLLDGPAMLDGLVAGVEADATGLVNKLSSTVQGFIDIAERRILAGEASAITAHDDLVALWSQYEALKEKRFKVNARKIGTAVTTTETTLTAFADTVGNTEQEIIDLNISLLNAPTVPRSTEIMFYL